MSLIEPSEELVLKRTTRQTRAAQALDTEQVFPGAGEMARLMRAMDWSQTPLGPVETWSPSLRMMVRFLIPNRFPMLLWWGPRFYQLYNDPYRPVLGVKHPRSIAQPASECWPEIWDVIGPLVESPYRGGPATWSDDLSLEVNRHDFVEETHFTVAYSPVPDETAPNGIGGVLATVNEISDEVVAERRVAVLRDLGARAAEARTAEEACQIAADTLAQHPKDVPFALLYLIDEDRKRARLAATVGVDQGAAVSPLTITLDSEASDSETQTSARDSWPLAEAIRVEAAQVVERLSDRFAAVPPGPWSDPPHTAVVAPIRSGIGRQFAGALVTGVSSRLRFNDGYRAFFELLSSQLAASIANARAFEQERERAEALAVIDRAKTAFFSNVSHEFRTPLTLLLGPMEDSLADVEQPLPARQRERLELMRRNGLRLLKLVNTLLDFARIQAGRAQVSYEPTDLAAYTAELASAFRSLVERAGLRLVVDCQPLPQPVYVDREMWEKIVLNLLSNAFKFTFEGAITVSLRPVAPHEGRDAQAVELVVQDTGAGIPAEELARLFERFHRVQGARSRTFEGSGIGLALVQELVQLHGGAITAKSVVGEGTTFTVTLPLGAAHLPAERIGARRDGTTTALGAAPYVEEAWRWLPDAPAQSEQREAMDDWLFKEPDAIGRRTLATVPTVPTASAARTAPARILLADDNADLRDYVKRLLSERYTVEAAANGAEALAMARLRPPDLVLADVMMPELDGFGLLHALRADPLTTATPVILLSARAGAEAAAEGLEVGADDYIAKPFSAREVLSRVAAHLELARLRNEAAVAATEAKRHMEEFLSIASHELRTPLTAIFVSIQMSQRSVTALAQALPQGLPDEVSSRLDVRIQQAQRLLGRTVSQVRRLDRLVGDLVDISRIQAGKLEFRMESCDLLAIVREAVREQRTSWPHRSITLNAPHRAALAVQADGDRIGQVVTNYLTNALKYSAANQPVAVRVRAQGGAARVEVRDHGPGLAPEQQEHVFEVFYRAPGIKLQSGSGVGLGLGLHICKTIIDRHGGSVGVESVVGQGSTFWFSLPSLPADIDEAPGG